MSTLVELESKRVKEVVNLIRTGLIVELNWNHVRGRGNSRLLSFNVDVIIILVDQTRLGASTNKIGFVKYDYKILLCNGP